MVIAERGGSIVTTRATSDGPALVAGPGSPRTEPSRMDQDFIDRIHECQFAPDLWPGVCDALARIADARGGFLFAANADGPNWTACESSWPGMELWVDGNFFKPARLGPSSRGDFMPQLQKVLRCRSAIPPKCARRG